MQDGWNYTHFVTPVSTLERDRYLSQPTLPTSPMRTSPVIVSGESSSSGCQMLRLKASEVPQTRGFSSGASATSSPAMLGFRRHSSNYQRAQSSMQLDTFYEDNSLHKRQHKGFHACFVVFLRDLGQELDISELCSSSFPFQGPRRNLRTSLERTHPSQERI